MKKMDKWEVKTLKKRNKRHKWKSVKISKIRKSDQTVRAKIVLKERYK